MIRRLSRHLDDRPLLAIILGLLAAFAILYFVTPSLFDGEAQPTNFSKSAT